MSVGAVTPEHCDRVMLGIYERRETVDRFDLVLTVEVVDALYQCGCCGARLTLHLESPMLAAGREVGG